MTTRASNHAIVLGRGIAGLLAARALSERFDEVTVIDRDDARPNGEDRPGVPQGRHVHALLASGQQILEELLPGLTHELTSHGAPIGDMLGDTSVSLNGHRLASAPSGLVALGVSRAMLERHVHRRVSQIRNVTFATPADVVGLTSDGYRGPVTGIRLLRRADDSPAETLYGDLVVDALGRTSRAPRWLVAIGHDAPREDRIATDLRYATRRYTAPDEGVDGLLAAISGPWPGHPRGATLTRTENDRWMLTLIGMTGESPGRDRVAFDEFARSVGSPEIDHILANGTQIGGCALFRFPASIRRRYEQLDHRPSGFLAVGDSVCSLNPVYGQGMSIAAHQAAALRGAGDAAGDELWSAIVPPVEGAWSMVRAADLAFPGVEGHRTLPERATGRYIERLHAAASTDPALAVSFMRVAGLVDPPQRLLAPRIAVPTLAPRLSGISRRSTRLRFRGGLTPARLIAAALVAPFAAIAGTIATAVAVRAAVRVRTVAEL